MPCNKDTDTYICIKEGKSALCCVCKGSKARKHRNCTSSSGYWTECKSCNPLPTPLPPAGPTSASLPNALPKCNKDTHICLDRRLRIVCRICADSVPTFAECNHCICKSCDHGRGDRKKSEDDPPYPQYMSEPAVRCGGVYYVCGHTDPDGINCDPIPGTDRCSYDLQVSGVYCEACYNYDCNELKSKKKSKKKKK